MGKLSVKPEPQRQLRPLLALAALGWAAAAGAQEAQAPPADPLRAGQLPVAPPPGTALPPVDTIIGDDEFNAAIPPLSADADPELDRPLESIEAFERRLAADQAGAKPEEGAAPPLGDPALADGQAREAIGDAPIRDAELAAPLPPLGSFEVTPTTFAEAAEDTDATQVGYAYLLTGLDPADELADADLADEFRDLSALHQGKGRAANLAQLNNRMSEDALLLKKLLAAEGWHDAQVASRLDLADPAAGRPLTAVLTVAPGKRFALSEIAVDAAATDPPRLIADALALNPGDPVVAERILAAEARVALALPQNGYPFAEVGQRDVLLDRDTGEADYTLPVSVGPRGRYGRIVSEGARPAFGAEHIAVLARFAPGELYDSRKVDDLRQALVATGLFSAVAVEPRRSGEATPDGAERVTIAVRQEAGPPRVLAGTAGYGTGEGLRAEVSWTHRNLFPPEGALIVSGLVGTLEQGAGVTFRRSNAGRRDRTFELGADLHHSDYDAFSAYTGRLAATVSYASTPLWQKRLGYAYGVQLLGTNESVFVPARGERTRRTYAIAGLTGELKLDTTDDLLDPTRGYRVALLAEPEGSLHYGFSPYLRLRVDGSAYRRLGAGLVAAARVRVGSIQNVSLDDLAPSRRFYAGGGGSVRGFGYQGLGPRDSNGDPTGGRSINEGAVELRYRFGDYGVAAFADLGQVYQSATPDFSNLRAGVGLGARVYTNFGPVRVDLATPLKRRAGESRINVYVSIGQAF